MLGVNGGGLGANGGGLGANGGGLGVGMAEGGREKAGAEGIGSCIGC